MQLLAAMNASSVPDRGAALTQARTAKVAHTPVRVKRRARVSGAS